MFNSKWLISVAGPTFSGTTASWPLAQTYSFTLPSCIPDGQYLLRIEQLAIHNPYPAGTPQVSSPPNDDCA